MSTLPYRDDLGVHAVLREVDERPVGLVDRDGLDPLDDLDLDRLAVDQLEGRNARIEHERALLAALQVQNGRTNVSSNQRAKITKRKRPLALTKTLWAGIKSLEMHERTQVASRGVTTRMGRAARTGGTRSADGARQNGQKQVNRDGKRDGGNVRQW